LSADNNIISTKVTTGNAPNKLEATNNMVEDNYAISEENSDEQGTINTSKSNQSRTNYYNGGRHNVCNQTKKIAESPIRLRLNHNVDQ